ncbi:NAD-dependent epimerase/dehydratase family protein [Brevibacillus panacihumi]|uniref:NAD-dependent epimerase/dehydratase family protein n=1 Tax=Brevibacillus panacihumi TaxID=497735 RepID=UPI003D031885
MEKVLITGGAGFIGSHLVEYLQAKGFEVAVADNLATGKKGNIPSDVTLYQVDVCSNQLKDAFEQFNPDVVIHLAAQSGVGHSLIDPQTDARVNIIGAINVLELCKSHNVEKIVFSSSAAVYGNNIQVPITEGAPLSPMSPYGLSKSIVEKYLDLYRQLFGISYTILRFSNVYGPRQNPYVESGVISIFIEKLVKNKIPVIFGDGKQTRDFIYVKDVCEAVMLSMFQKQSFIYNISSGVETSINDLLILMCSLMGKDFCPKYSESRSADILKSCLDNNKAVSELSWIPKTTLNDGIQQVLQSSSILSRL